MSQPPATASPAEIFEAERPRLGRLAYSILGSVADADDAVQETWLRWARQDHALIDSPRAWLTTTASRVALDELRTARRRREDYVGTWLPEPRVERWDDTADAAIESDDVTTALLVVLEQLSPVERVAFLLCDVFGMPSQDVAGVVGKNSDAVRQAARRGRGHVSARAPRYEADPAAHMAVVARFAEACEGRSLKALVETLAPEVTFRSDGGGLVTATRKPVTGKVRVGAMLAGFAATALRKGHALEVTLARVNGRAGVIFRVGQEFSVYAIETHGGRITEFNVMRNPEKLRSVYAGGDGWFSGTAV